MTLYCGAVLKTESNSPLFAVSLSNHQSWSIVRDTYKGAVDVVTPNRSRKSPLSQNIEFRKISKMLLLFQRSRTSTRCPLPLMGKCNFRNPKEAHTKKKRKTNERPRRMCVDNNIKCAYMYLLYVARPIRICICICIYRLCIYLFSNCFGYIFHFSAKIQNAGNGRVDK